MSKGAMDEFTAVLVEHLEEGEAGRALAAIEGFMERTSILAGNLYIRRLLVADAARRVNSPSHAVAHAEYSLGALRLYEAEVGPGNHGYETVCEILSIEPREEEI